MGNLSLKRVVDLLISIVILIGVILLSTYLFIINTSDDNYVVGTKVSYIDQCNCKVNSVDDSGVYIYCEISKDRTDKNGIKHGPDSILIGGLKFEDLSKCEK